MAEQSSMPKADQMLADILRNRQLATWHCDALSSPLLRKGLCGYHLRRSNRQSPAPNTPCVPAARSAVVSTSPSFGCDTCPTASSCSWGTSFATRATSTSVVCAGAQTRGGIRNGAALKLFAIGGRPGHVIRTRERSALGQKRTCAVQ